MDQFSAKLFTYWTTRPLHSWRNHTGFWRHCKLDWYFE